MKILLTIDYELFLGTKTGSVKNCLIKPLDALTSIGDKFGAKFTLFVDATYLYALDKYKAQFPDLQKDWEDIRLHLISLEQKGHDIQLHIHPHWFYSSYNGKEWIIDNDHYKLSDLTPEDAQTVFSLSKNTLESIIGKKTVAFRAGGFSAQPTERLLSLFKGNDIRIDSSVYPGNYYDSPHQKYDYRNCPDKSLYHFNADICKEDASAPFIEIPLSTYRLSPFYYWKFVLTKLSGGNLHKRMGDGVSVKTTNDSIISRLTKFTDGFATIDGYKINYLMSAFKKYKKKKSDVFCVLGHSKLATNYSLKKFRDFCELVYTENEFITFSYLLEHKK
jgi:hypothetical protein